MKNMAIKANLPGRKTNHSARKSTCTRLLHAGVAPTTIQQLTGHRNVQSVNNYAVASVEMQKKHEQYPFKHRKYVNLPPARTTTAIDMCS